MYVQHSVVDIRSCMGRPSAGSRGGKRVTLTVKLRGILEWEKGETMGARGRHERVEQEDVHQEAEGVLEKKKHLVI